MMGIGRWSARRKALAAAAFALLLVVPAGVSETTGPLVTGHSTFFNGAGYDPCLASIAGILRTQVMWFNDQILAERYGGKGTYIYLTENGSEDPRADPIEGERSGLYTEGVFYDFVDPNGVHWHVDEAFFDWTPPSVDPLGGSVKNPNGFLNNPQRTYVWIVELSAFPIHDQFAGSPNSPNYHDLYNFLLIVDTCKFHRSHRTNYNGGLQNPDPRYEHDFNITHDRDVLNPGYGHEAGVDPHKHESFVANLWIGQKPILVPSGASTQGAQWESEWAVGSAQGNAASKYPGRPDTDDPSSSLPEAEEAP